MGLNKVDGSVPWEEARQEVRMNAAPPEVMLYENNRITFKYYATRFLALTALTDPAILDRVRNGAEALETPPDGIWTQADAELLLEAGGMPPAPSHVQVAQLPGQSILVMRAALPGARNARKLSYATGSIRPNVSVLRELRAAGQKVPAGTCLEVPVKLMEDEHGLLLALLLRNSRSRSLQEVNREDDERRRA